ncbi:MAG: DegT/DnrJ/EryC1/StrS aminotransferase family protein, partial [Solirubrobacteraceae bacterium]
WVAAVSGPTAAGDGVSSAIGGVVSHPSAYEHRFAELLGGEVTAFAFWKGRVALYAILRAMGIGPGDEVLVPGFTCVVVPSAVRLTGAVPIYADIDAEGFNVDPACVERLLTPRCKAILLQHSFGTPAAIDEVHNLAQAHDLRLIEDCAHTIAGAHHGRRLGTVGHASFYSFQWSKPYTTGLGGMAVTRDPGLAQRLRAVQDSFVEPPLSARVRLNVQYWLYRRFFTSRRYWLAQDVLHAISRTGLFIGSSSEGELTGDEPTDHTWRMAQRQQDRGEGLIAAVGTRAQHAQALADRYEHQLTQAGWATPERAPDAPLLRYPMLVANQNELLSASRTDRIELGSWFESPLHPLPLELHHLYGYTLGQCPNAEHRAQQIVNLPLHGGITPDQADQITQFFTTHARPPQE